MLSRRAVLGPWVAIGLWALASTGIARADVQRVTVNFDEDRPRSEVTVDIRKPQVVHFSLLTSEPPSTLKTTVSMGGRSETIPAFKEVQVFFRPCNSAAQLCGDPVSSARTLHGVFLYVNEAVNPGVAEVHFERSGARPKSLTLKIRTVSGNN